MDTPQLSRGFFQKFLENDLPPGFKPILQIMEARQTKQANQCYRLRMSDGQFAYSGCCTTDNVAEEFVEDDLVNGTAIIRVIDYSRNVGAKTMLAINKYVLISKEFPVLGNLTHHTGNPNDFKGIENFQLSKYDENVGVSKQMKRPGSPYDSRQPLAKRSTNGHNDEDAQNLTEMSLITPYINKWRICGVVSAKENVRDVKSAKGNFRVFSFTVTDKCGNSIKISAFGAEAERFNPIITNGQAYYIGGGGPNTVRAANKMYNATGHDYELVLGRESEVTLCTNIQFDEPTFKITPVPLNRLAEHTGHLVDVFAIVDRLGDLTQVTTRKDSRQLDKRDIFLVDESGVEVALTLWGDKATNFEVSTVGKVIGVKGVSVREFNGGLSLSPSMTYFEIKYNPEGEATNRLYLWYSETRPKTEIKTLSSSTEMSTSFDRDFRLIGLAIEHRMGQESDRGVYFNVKAMINSVRTENAFYQACPTSGCRKKLISENNQYRCDKCNATYDNFQNIVMLSVELADFSGTAWATIFDDKATALLGVTGDKMAELFREDTSQYEALFDQIRFREFSIRVRVKYEMYNNQQQMKWTIFDLKPVPYDRCKRIYSEALAKCANL